MCSPPRRPSVAQLTKRHGGADMLARLSLGTIALCLGAGAAIADTLADCSQGRNADVRLRACSEVIAGTRIRPRREGARLPQSRQRARRCRGQRAGRGRLQRGHPSSPQRCLGLCRPGAGTARAARCRRLRSPTTARPFASRRRHRQRRLSTSARAMHTSSRATLAAAIADFTEAIRLNPNSPSTLQPSRPRLPQVRRPGARDRRLHRGDHAQSRSTRSPTTTAATSTRRRAARRMRSPISRRRSCSIPR